MWIRSIILAAGLFVPVSAVAQNLDVEIGGCVNIIRDTAFTSTRAICEALSGKFVPDVSAKFVPDVYMPIVIAAGSSNSTPIEQPVLHVEKWTDLACSDGLTPTIRLHSKEKRVEVTCE